MQCYVVMAQESDDKGSRRPVAAMLDEEDAILFANIGNSKASEKDSDSRFWYEKVKYLHNPEPNVFTQENFPKRREGTSGQKEEKNV